VASDVSDWRSGVSPVSAWMASLRVSSQTVVDVHRGAVLPEGRIIVLAVPVAALLFYLLVVRRNRGR
jgi:hypothetical protein